MDVIRCHNVIEYAQTEALLASNTPAQVTAPIARELEEKFFLMEAVGDIPDVTRERKWRFARAIETTLFMPPRNVKSRTCCGPTRRTFCRTLLYWVATHKVDPLRRRRARVRGYPSSLRTEIVRYERNTQAVFSRDQPLG
jgi:hypothetical protein